jgi:hypothetical protein
MTEIKYARNVGPTKQTLWTRTEPMQKAITRICCHIPRLPIRAGKKLLKKPRRYYENPEVSQLRAKQKVWPEALGPRRSSLTIQSHDNSTDQHALMQPGLEGFLRLPLEVRLMIYGYVFGMKDVHFGLRIYSEGRERKSIKLQAADCGNAYGSILVPMKGSECCLNSRRIEV